MKVWIVEPRDPLIARDGRPFGNMPGSQASSLPFPFPSTTTGGVRTREGLDADGYFQTSEIPRIKKIGVLGPFLVELDMVGGDISRWMAPAPGDALLFDSGLQNSGKVFLKQLVPLELPEGAAVRYPDNLYNLAGMPYPVFGKPSSKAPRYWAWDIFEKWLKEPGNEEIELNVLGHDGPLLELRTHVAVNEATQTPLEGALFQTRGLEFTKASGTLTGERLALAVATNVTGIKPGLAPLGGERRLVNWRSSKMPLPTCSTEIKNSIVRYKSCRIILLTPAYFRRGWKPSWLLDSGEGISIELVSAVFGRPQVVSGWNFEINKPKPTRRLAPAGSVYYLKLEGGSKAEIIKWIEKIWMRCVSDEKQDRLDGFGLAVLGSWDGKLQTMEV